MSFRNKQILHVHAVLPVKHDADRADFVIAVAGDIDALALDHGLQDLVICRSVADIDVIAESEKFQHFHVGRQPVAAAGNGQDIGELDQYIAASVISSRWPAEQYQCGKCSQYHLSHVIPRLSDVSHLSAKRVRAQHAFAAAPRLRSAAA